MRWNNKKTLIVILYIFTTFFLSAIEGISSNGSGNLFVETSTGKSGNITLNTMDTESLRFYYQSLEANKELPISSKDDFKVFSLKSIDIGVINYHPFGRLNYLTKMNLGGKAQFNFELFEIEPLRLFIYTSGAYNFSNIERLPLIIDVIGALGAGWTFNFEIIGITPSAAYGYLGQITYGDFTLNGEKEYLFFSNQMSMFSLEVSINPWEKVSLYIAPGIIMFSGEEYWGYEAGGELGVRINF